MAERWAVASGNWSATGTWNGGTLPGVADDVYANNFAVTIDQDIDTLSIRTTAGTTPVVGGSFTASAARNINADIYSGTTGCLNLTHTTGTTTITGNILGSATTAVVTVSQNGVGSTLVVNGNVTGGGFAGSTGLIVAQINCFLTINGNLLGGSVGTTYGVRLNASSAGCTLVVVGSITGGGNTTANGLYCEVSVASFTQSGGSITGSSTSAAAGANFVSSLVSGTIGGTITGGVAGSYGANFAGAAVLNLTVNNNCACGAGAAGGYGLVVAGAVTGTVTINGNCIGPAGAAVHGFNMSTSGVNVNINGNCTGGAFAAGKGAAIATTGTIIITGTCTGGSATTAYGFHNQGNAAAITIIGSIVGGTAGVTSNGVLLDGIIGSFTQHTGTISGNFGPGLTFNNNCTTFSITGNVTGGNLASGATGVIFTSAIIASGTIVGNCAAGATATGAHGVSDTRNASGLLTITGTCTGGPGAAVCGYTSGGGASATINGNVTGGNAGLTSYGAQNGGTGTMTINGDVTTGTQGMGVNAVGANGTTIINGNVTNVATLTACFGAQASSNHNLTVNGNVTANQNNAVASGAGVNSSSTGIVTITGIVAAGGGATSSGLTISGAGTYRVGTAKSNNYPNSGIAAPTPGVTMSANTQSCVVDALEFGSGGANPLGAVGKWYIRAAGTNTVKMRESNVGAVVNMTDGGFDYPAIADVRLGTLYNFGANTGSLAVPAAANVALGIAVDNTVGSAVLTGAAVWNEVLEGAFTAKGIMRLLAAYAAGNAANMDASASFTGLDGTTTRITGTISGANRTITSRDAA